MELCERNAEGRNSVMGVVCVGGHLLARLLRSEVEIAKIGSKACQQSIGASARLARLRVEAEFRVVHISGELGAVLAIQFLVVLEKSGEVWASDELEGSARIGRSRHDEVLGRGARDERELLELETADGHILLHREHLLHILLLALETRFENHAIASAEENGLQMRGKTIAHPSAQLGSLRTIPSYRFDVIIGEALQVDHFGLR